MKKLTLIMIGAGMATCLFSTMSILAQEPTAEELAETQRLLKQRHDVSYWMNAHGDEAFDALVFVAGQQVVDSYEVYLADFAYGAGYWPKVIDDYRAYNDEEALAFKTGVVARIEALSK